MRLALWRPNDPQAPVLLLWVRRQDVALGSEATLTLFTPLFQVPNQQVTWN